jgi:uncharacterized membrane protein YgcG
MKAKLYIGIIAAVLLPGFLVQAQIANSRDYGYNNTSVEVNNYYNYDYYYSSRINRFHRSFSTFNYYAPVFTDSYWYNYDPFSWGLSIYGNSGFGYGLSYNYPVYYDYGWNSPYFGGSYNWGFDPFFYNSWYSPVVINIGFGNRWHHNNYGWHGRNRWDYDYRPVYNTYNNYYYSNSNSNSNANSYPSNSNYSRRSEPVNSNAPINNISRREGSNNSRTDISRDERNRSSNTINNSESRRQVNAPVTRGGNNNGSVNRGNTSVINNSPNRNTNQPLTNPSDNQVNRRYEQAPVRNQGNVTTRPVQSERSQNVNTNSNKTVIRPESTSVPQRRTNVSPGSNSGSGRTVATPSGSSSSSVKSGSVSRSSNSSSRSGSGTSGNSGSSSSGGKGRRK